MSDHLGDSTLCVHAGLPDAVPGQPLMPGPVFAAPYHLDPEGYVAGQDGYGRADNPTRRVLEAALAELEGGDVLAFASGQAAITATLMAVLRPGDTLMLPSDGYYNVRTFAAAVFAELKVEVVEVPTAGPYPGFDGVRLVLLESPANPSLDVVDIAAVAASARAAGALVAVDNTAATPLGQRPLDLGADIVVASGTKALSGHSDLLLGYVATRSPELLAAMTSWRSLAGGIPSPFDAWLARRSLATLDLRLRRHTANAAALAVVLQEDPLVRAVRWPGLATDPSYAIASKQMRRIPGIIGFELPSAAHVAAFLRAARFVGAATSFGGLHTTADRREQWGDRTAPGFVRLSCGIEDTADLVVDVRQALATLSR
jgi:cystathionine gamma-lyase